MRILLAPLAVGLAVALVSACSADRPTATITAQAPVVRSCSSATATWQVRSGDTLTAIAARCSTTVEALQRLNGIRNASSIRAGSTIKVRTPYVPEPEPARTPTPRTTVTATPTVKPTPKVTPKPKATGWTAKLALLKIAAESNGGWAYDRDFFGGWDRSGCQDTRAQILEAWSLSPTTGSCTIVSGRWIGYDGAETTVAHDLDIDHVVALSEAWHSGANAWDSTKAHEYANYWDNLLPVTASVNRSKGDDDAAEFLPGAPNTCMYARHYVNTKLHWKLTVDRAEFDALRSLHC